MQMKEIIHLQVIDTMPLQSMQIDYIMYKI